MDLKKEDNHLLAFAALAISVLIVYGNALFNGFVYDDSYLILGNDFIKGFSHLREILFNDVTVTTSLGEASGYYRPVPMIYLMATYKLWGTNPFGYHLQSIILHILNSCFVFMFIERLCRQRRVAFFSALIFAIHPIHVEAVVPAYNVMGLLATLFSLLAIINYLDYRKEKKASCLILSLIWLILALFSKEEAVMVPVLYVLYDMFTIHRFHAKGLLGEWKIYMGLVLALLFYFAMRKLAVEQSTLLGLWNMHLYFNILPPSHEHVLWPVVIAAHVILKYIQILIVPVNLCAFHLMSVGWGFESYLGIFLVIGLIVLSFTIYPRNLNVSFIIWFFLITILPVSNLIPIGGIFAERFMYFPSIAYCFLLGLGLTFVYQKWQRTKYQAFKIALLLIPIGYLYFYALTTAMRNYVWRNNISLWRVTVLQSPGHILPHLNLASAYYQSHRYPEALAEYKAALTFPSGQKPYIHNGLGKVYGILGRYDLAYTEFKTVNDLVPLFPEGFYNTGITLFHLKQSDLAMSYFQKAMSLDQSYPWSYYGMGLVLEEKFDFSQAEDMYLKSLQLAPNFQEAKDALIRVRDRLLPNIE